jgi:salicylate hydroxylase
MDEILIIGGGIAGLTAALALLRQGKRVKLFEQAEAFGDVGAGLTLTQPASRGLFSLGLRSAIEAAADIPAKPGAADYASGERVEGTVKRAIPMSPNEDIPIFYQLHRADLHQILLDALEKLDPYCIQLGKTLTDVAQDDQGVRACFADGSTVSGSILLGGDGINSRVRECLFGKESPRFTGQVAYRFLIPYADVESFMHLGPSINYLGPKRTLLRYVIRHGSVVNGVAFVRTDDYRGEGWGTAVNRAELLEKFADWNADIQGLLSNAPTEGTRKWALFDRDPLDRWTVGRVTLMGDAAHPMLPFLGLGAAMGIEDAVVLGRAFAEESDPLEALRRYEETRRGRANRVLLASREQGEIMQSEEADKRPVDIAPDLYAYDPVTAPLAA